MINQKKKGGRPPKPEHEKMRHQIQFYVDDSGLRKLENWRQQSGLDQADLIRDILFKRKIRLYTRNQSLDELAVKLSCGLSEINKAGEILALAVQKLSEFQHCYEVNQHLAELEKAVNTYLEMLQNHKQITAEIARIWLQD